MPAITTNGVTLYYEAYGKLSDGGTVFLIPGLGMQHWMWPDTLIETLVKGGAGVVVMDNRDCGRSSRCSGRVSMGRVFGSIGRTLTRRPVSGVYGLEEMASDVVGLASRLGIRTFHAAGISMGGMIAQVLAARYPESVLSLTSMSSATGNPRTGLGKFSAIWATIRPQSRLASESEGVKRLDRFIRAMGSVSYERTDAEKRRLVRLMARNPGDPDGFRRQLLALLQSGDRRTQVSGIRAPTLVLHGLSDKLLPPRAGKETADLISGARLEMIPRLGHDLPPALGAKYGRLMLENFSRASSVKH